MTFTQLNQFKKITIQCHDNPDADALACAYALSEYFTLLQKETEIVYSGFAPVSKSNLKLMMDELGIKARFIPAKDDSTDYSKEPDSLLLVVDAQYGGGNVKKLPAAAIGIIDHHIQRPEMPPLVFCDIRSFLGSCSTLVWLLLKNCGFDFDKHINVSTALYYGLYSDTGGLPEITHPLDRDLRDSIKYDKVLLKRLRNCNLTTDDLTLAGKSLMSGRIDPATKSAVFYAEPCDPNMLGFVSDLALQVDTIDSCVVFCEVSGGGHADKAGGSISADFISRSGFSSLESLSSHYTPTVKNAKEGQAENIEKFIRPCVNRGETVIYAKQLAKSAKVFTEWNSEGYMYGKPGDWLALRSDDPNDVYIIQDSIFRLTYRTPKVIQKTPNG